MNVHSLDDYVKHLRSWGLTVVVIHKPARSGAWGMPYALFLHHTGDTCDPADVQAVLRVVRDGRSDVPGPLAQELVGQDCVVYVIATPQPGQVAPGRCNHAGKGEYPRLHLSLDNGNPHSSGTEVQCSGQHPLSTHVQQYRVVIRLLAAKAAFYNLTASAVIGHKEYAPRRKVDPKDDMNHVRRDVADELRAGPTTDPTPSPTEDDMPLTADDARLVAQTLLNQPLSLGPENTKANGGKATILVREALVMGALQARSANVATRAAAGALSAVAAATGADTAALVSAAEQGASRALAQALQAAADAVDNA